MTDIYNNESKPLLDKYNDGYSEELQNDGLIEEEAVDLVLESCSKRRTFINLLKIALGTGVLTLPYGFSKAGIVPSILCVIGAAAMNFLSVMMLISCHSVCSPESKSKTFTSYSAVAYQAFGRPGVIVADLLLIVTTFGAGTSFLIFVETTMKFVYSGFPEYVWVIISVVGLCPLVCLNDLSFMSYTSAAGLVLLGVGFGTVFGYGASNNDFEIPADRFFNWEKMPFCFSLCAYAFAYPIVFFPCYDQMKSKKKKKADFLNLLTLTLVIVCIVFSALGIVSFGCYSNQGVQDNIINNLPNGSPYTAIVRTSLSMVILLSYPLCFYLPNQMIGHYLASGITSERGKKFAQYSSRILLLVVSGLVAGFVPQFSGVVAIIGAFTISISCFVLPPLGFYYIFRHELTFWEKMGSLCYSLFSLVLMGYTTYDAVKSFIDGGTPNP